jgi:hypothetical protein
MFGQGAGGGGGGWGNFDTSKINPMAIVVVGIIVVSGMLTMVGDTYAFKKVPATISQKLLTLPVFVFYKITGERTTADALTAAIYIGVLCAVGFWLWKLLKTKVLEPMQMKDLAKETDRKEVLFNQFRNK